MPSHFDDTNARWFAVRCHFPTSERDACRSGSTTRRDKMGAFRYGAEKRAESRQKRSDLVAIKITIRLPHLHGMIATKPYDGSGEAMIGVILSALSPGAWRLQLLGERSLLICCRLRSW